MQPLFEGVEGREVVGCRGLALKDGEVDLHLIQPTGMHRRVDRNDGRPLLPDTIDTGLAAVGGAVVHGPEHPTSGAIGFLRHHVLQEAAEWCDAGLVFAKPMDFGPTYIPGGQVGPCPLTHVLMFDAHGLAGSGRQSAYSRPKLPLIPRQSCHRGRLPESTGWSGPTQDNKPVV